MCANICSWEICSDCWITMGNLHINSGTLQLTCYYSPIDWKWQCTCWHFPRFSVSFHTLWSGSGPGIPPTLARAAHTLLITKSNGLSLLLLPSTRLDHLSHWPPHPSWPTLLYLVHVMLLKMQQDLLGMSNTKVSFWERGFLPSFAQ